MNLLPSLNYSCSILIQEETQCSVVGPYSSWFDEPITSMFYGESGARINSVGGWSKNTCDLKCSFCDKKSHKIDKFWRKHGVPDDVRKRWIASKSHSQAVNHVAVPLSDESNTPIVKGINKRSIQRNEVSRCMDSEIGP